MKWLALPLMALTLAACSSAPKKSSPPPSSADAGRRAQPPMPTQASAAGCTQKYSPAQEDLSKRGDYQAGGLYAPHVPDTTPDHVPDVDCIAEPLVTSEPRSAIGNRSPYSVLGKKYEVMQRVDGYVERGTASYYGNKFHGRRTSNQEVYDMYAFTAAHKTLPLPSFARVTNLDNGKSVVVRVNDRGPFHEGRVIDLSYAAAVKLGITQRGTGNVEVRALTSTDQGSLLASAPAAVKTTIATGIPTRIATGKPTPMDELVGNLPKQTPATTTATKAIATDAGASSDPSQPWRYHVTPQLDKKPTADEFDAWMSSRGVRVATGKPAAVESRPASAAPAVVEVARAAPPAAARPTSTPTRSDGDVQLQVASFASRENADRALARLSAAGIARASLSDVASNGRTLWRLRVDAADQAAATELAGRIAGLGFGQPQVVRE
ncbi:septal ring lytic transglycosylase RlpA family protein [Pseudoxanthomonas sacheonensis]|uniref:Endolytic peptidoglycan transglycosylase RlpA n=1 Tax=Pseudoxanthomonas sacheonensis TaxID=443615 RepID=A0ABU1RVD8_9GAMM|nr:septal ring lytic transglycosylase RlpA family protein [Pseudoxanthomonas sacheonensis]MDR6842740.1 rare lipoprotein A [Pseudoxanthomonas sacheonensis]